MSFLLMDILRLELAEKETLLQREVWRLYREFEGSVIRDNVVQFKDLNLRRRKIGAYCLENNDVDSYINYLKKQLQLVQDLWQSGQIEKIAILLNLNAEDTSVVSKILKVDAEQQLLLWLLIYNDEQLQDAEELDIPKLKVREFRRALIEYLSEKGIFDVKQIAELLPKTLARLKKGILDNQPGEIALTERMLVQWFEYCILEEDAQSIAKSVHELINELPKLFSKLFLPGLSESTIRFDRYSSEFLTRISQIDSKKIKEQIAYLLVFMCAGHAARVYDLSREEYNTFKREILKKLGIYDSRAADPKATKELIILMKSINAEEEDSLSTGVEAFIEYCILLIEDFTENRPKEFAEKLVMGCEFFNKEVEKIEHLIYGVPFLELELTGRRELVVLAMRPVHQAIYWLEKIEFEDDLALYTNTPFAKIQDFRKQVQIAICGHYKEEDVFSFVREEPKDSLEQLTQFSTLNHGYLKTAYRERDSKKFAEGIRCLFNHAVKAYKRSDFASLNRVLFLEPGEFGKVVVLFEQGKTLEIYKIILNKYLGNLSRKAKLRYNYSDCFYSRMAIESVMVEEDTEMSSFVDAVYRGLDLSDPPSVPPRYYSAPSSPELFQAGDTPKEIAEWAKTFQETLKSQEFVTIAQLAKAAKNLFMDAFKRQDLVQAKALFEVLFSPLREEIAEALKKQYCKFIDQFLAEVNLSAFNRQDISRMFQLLKDGSNQLLQVQIIMNISWETVSNYSKSKIVKIPLEEDPREKASHHKFLRKLLRDFRPSLSVDKLENLQALFARFLTEPPYKVQFDQRLAELITYIHYLYVESMLGNESDVVSSSARKELVSMAVAYAKAQHEKIKELPQSSIAGRLLTFYEGFDVFIDKNRLAQRVWDAFILERDASPWWNFMARACLPTHSRSLLYAKAAEALKIESEFSSIPTNPLLPTCKVALAQIEKASKSKGISLVQTQAIRLLLDIFAHHISIEDHQALGQDLYHACDSFIKKKLDLSIVRSVVLEIGIDSDPLFFKVVMHTRNKEELFILLLGAVFSREMTRYWREVGRNYYLSEASLASVRNKALDYIQENYNVKIVPKLKSLDERLALLLKSSEDREVAFCAFEKDFLLFDALARRDQKTLVEAVKMLTNFAFEAYRKNRLLLVEFFQLASGLHLEKLEKHRSEDWRVYDANKRLLRWTHNLNANNPKQIMIMILEEVFKRRYQFLTYEESQKLENDVFESLGITVLDRFDPYSSAARSSEELKQIADFVYSQSNAGVDFLRDPGALYSVAKKEAFIKLLPKPEARDSEQYRRTYNKIQDVWRMHLVAHRFSLQTDTHLEGSRDNTMLQQIQDSFLSYLDQKENKERDEAIRHVFQSAKLELKQESEFIRQFKDGLKEDAQALFLRGENSVELKLRFEQGKQLSFPVYTKFSDSTGEISGHLSGAVFFKLGEQWFMFKSDRGGDTPSKQAGIILYKVTKPEDIVEVAGKMAASYGQYDERMSNEAYTTLLKDKLGLERVGYIYKKPQFIGSCGFISAAKPLVEINCLVHTMQLIYQKNPDLTTEDLVIQAKTAVKPLSSAFSVYDRYQILKSFIEHLKAQLAIQAYTLEDLRHIKILLAQVKIMNENRNARQQILELLDAKNLPKALTLDEECLAAANKALFHSMENLLLHDTELGPETLTLRTKPLDMATRELLTCYRSKSYRDSAAFGSILSTKSAALVTTLPQEVLARVEVKKRS